MTPGAIAQLASVLEATARKPGNVHRFADFQDVGYLDFLLSAQAIVGPLDRASEAGIGRTVLECVRETQRYVSTNTNLGMILLFTPLAAVPEGRDLRVGVHEVLENLTTDDARQVYEAIRLADPGGIGSVDDQDIRAEPTVTLLDAMRLAADRDSIARQYVNGFADVFDLASPVLAESIELGQGWETAVVNTYLHLLVELPDTLMLRKRGADEATAASDRAALVLEAGWPNDEFGLVKVREFDSWLRAVGHSRNPGATADLVSAALFAALRDGTIRFPLSAELRQVGPFAF